MVRQLAITAPRRVEVHAAKRRAPGPNEARVRTLFSGISHGTEMNVYRGIAPQWRKHYDQVTRLFVDSDEPDWQYPLAYGYANVGAVEEIGSAVKDLRVGQHVFAYRNHITEYVAPAAQLVPLPDGLPPICAVFLANLNTAYNGILDAGIVLGDTVVIFGQGVIGLLQAQLAGLCGAEQVITVDTLETRRVLSEKLGATRSLDPTALDVAHEVRAATENRGADVVIEVSGSPQALNEAVRTVAPQARVVVMSWYGDNLSRVNLAGEFHHNRVQLISSQVGSVNPALGPRWSVPRRMQQAVRLLGRLDLESLISHRLPFEDGGRGYELIDARTPDLVQVVLEYGC